jgi:hypothetical protein
VASLFRPGGAADGDAGFHRRVIEEVRSQAEDVLDGIGFDEIAPHLALLLTEEHVVRKQNGTAAGLRRQALQNVLPKGIGSPALRRSAVEIAPSGVRGECVAVPLLDGIGRIGQDDVEAHQAVALHQLGLGEGVAAFDVEIPIAVEEAVHTSDGGGHQVAFLPVEAHVAPLLPSPVQVGDGREQHAAGAAGRLVEGVALAGSEDVDHQPDHGVRRVELAGLLIGDVRELNERLSLSRRA